jgi:hypothetical protein
MPNTSEISSIECASSSKARYSSSSSILDFNGTHKLGNRQTSIKYIPTRVTISTYYQKAVSIRLCETQKSKNEFVNSFFDFLVSIMLEILDMEKYISKIHKGYS